MIESPLEDLRAKFLDPSEKKRNDLLKLIQYAFDSLPKNLEENDPFLGEHEDYSFMKDFEEIPITPKDRKAILSAVTKALYGQVRWHSPSTLHNITPPPMLDSIAINAITNLYNANMLWDYVSAGSHQIEHQIIRQISSLIGWDSKTGGCFTFGGKGCLLYAIRLGLNRCFPEVSMKGIHNYRAPVVITSKFNHYIIENVCSLIGLGSNSCIRVDAKEDETLDLFAFRATLEKVLINEDPIACIILSGGNTLHISIDPLQEAVEIIDELCVKYKLTYRPYIYFDMVVGWPWLFFKKYDFKKNKLDLEYSVLNKLKNAFSKISFAYLADGVGLDFHKLGFCPYSTSLFITKNSRELQMLHTDKGFSEDPQPYGLNFLQHFTIEHSRSAAPVLGAWTALQNAGFIGFQTYLAHLVSIGEVFSEILTNYDFEWLNPFSLGFSSVYCPVFEDSHYDYEMLLKSSPTEIKQYNQYVYELFKYLQDGDLGISKRMILRFLSKYHQAECGEWPAAIAVYPMSLHITKEKAKEFAIEIGERKHHFEMRNEKQFEETEIPYAIHK